LNALGFRLDLAPSPILAVQPTIEMARRFSRQRSRRDTRTVAHAEVAHRRTSRGKLVTSELFKAFRSGAALILTGREFSSSV